MTLLSLGAIAQEASDPVVATINGTEWKRSQFDNLVKNLPPQFMAAYNSSKTAWVQQYGLLQLLAEQAKKDGIDQLTPYKQQIEYNSQMFLARALLDHKGATADLSPELLDKWFQRYKGQYQRAHVRAILIKWGGIPKEGEKSRTDVEANTLITEIEGKLKGGASFAELAAKYSEDEDGRKNGGAYPLVKPEDPALSPAVRIAVMPLKPGEVSKVVRMPNAMYLFQLIDFQDATLEDLHQEAIMKVTQEQSIAWLESMRQKVKVEIKDPAYFGQPAKQ
jgi:peptidyl-prolyl cis-trans isomerase C